MKSTIRIEDPDNVVITLQLTMPAKQWRLLRSQLKMEHPSTRLHMVISEAIDKISRVLYVDENEEAG